jgi:hypothetical protein
MSGHQEGGMLDQLENLSGECRPWYLSHVAPPFCAHLAPSSSVSNRREARISYSSPTGNSPCSWDVFCTCPRHQREDRRASGRGGAVAAERAGMLRRMNDGFIQPANHAKVL